MLHGSSPRIKLTFLDKAQKKLMYHRQSLRKPLVEPSRHQPISHVLCIEYTKNAPIINFRYFSFFIYSGLSYLITIRSGVFILNLKETFWLSHLYKCSELLYSSSVRNSAEKKDTRRHCYISVSKVVYLFILILIKCQGLLHSSKLSLLAKSIYLFTGVQRLENFITMSVYVLRLILC